MNNSWKTCRHMIHYLLPVSTRVPVHQIRHVATRETNPFQKIHHVSYSTVPNDLNKSSELKNLEKEVELCIHQLSFLDQKTEKPISLVHIDRLMENLSNTHSMYGAKLAEKLLSCLEDSYERYISGEPFVILPNAISYNHVIHAYAMSNGGNKAADKCEEILDRMLQRCRNFLKSVDKKGLPPPEPLVTTFNSVMNAISKCNDENSGRRAEAIYRKMERWTFDCLECEGFPSFVYHGVQPNSRSLAIVLDCWANAKSEESFNRSVCIFEYALEEIKKYSANKESDSEIVSPINITMLNAVLKVLVNCGKGRSAAQKAEQLVAQMKEMHQNGTLATMNSFINRLDEECRETNPNVRTWTLLLNCWASAVQGDRDIDCAQQAENILHQMEECYKQGENVKPNAVTYLTCLLAWSRTQSDIGGRHAMNILQRLQDIYEVTKDENLKPNSLHYNTCLNALCIPQNQSLYNDAKLLLETMERKGVADVVSYNSLIKWQVSNNALHAYDEALDFIQRMRIFGIKPDYVTFNTLIDACGKSKNENRSSKAMELLDHMISNSGSDPDIHPTTLTFTTVLNIIAKSTLEEKVDPARKIFRQLLTLHETRDDDRLKPDTRCFSAFIGACANQEGSDEHKRVALKTAIGTYEQLIKHPEYGRPNSFIYGGLIKCCGRLTRDNTEKERLLTYLFDKCKSEGLVNKSVLNILIKSYPSKSRYKILGEKFDLNRIPREWSQHISK